MPELLHGAERRALDELVLGGEASEQHRQRDDDGGGADLCEEEALAGGAAEGVHPCGQRCEDLAPARLAAQAYALPPLAAPSTIAIMSATTSQVGFAGMVRPFASRMSFRYIRKDIRRRACRPRR